MGRRKAWQEIRECGVCGNEYMPKYSNQVYCCSEHANIARKAKASKMGRRMLKEEPMMAQAWYGNTPD